MCVFLSLESRELDTEAYTCSSSSWNLRLMDSEFRISLDYMGKEKRKKEKNMRQKGEERSLVNLVFYLLPRNTLLGNMDKKRIYSELRSPY